MKIFKKVLNSIVFLPTLLFLPSSLADTLFRPDKLEVRFYEMGFRNSESGEFASVFSNSNGIVIDLSSPESVQTLSSNVNLSNTGTFDQMYVLVSNTVLISGNKDGCYIKEGEYSYNEGNIPAATSNSELAGTAIMTETGFGGEDASTADITTYRVSPAVSSSVNGVAVNNLLSYLVNGTNKNPGSGGPYNRYLYLGDLQSSINLDSSKEGTLWIDTDTSQTAQLENDCTEMNWVNTKFGMSVEQ